MATVDYLKQKARQRRHLDRATNDARTNDILEEQSISVRHDDIQSGRWSIEGGRASMQRLILLK